MAGTLITDRRTATATYRILRRLGKGGMAEVFLAEQEGMAGIRRLVVVKKILPQFSDVESVAEMLKDEARIAVQLNHPNIVQIYELGLDEGQYFIAMEYVDGCDLATLARIERHRESRIPLRLSLRAVAEAAMGLDFAHRQKDIDGRPLNVIHRDVSPHNVLCSREGAVKMTDFGIAKAIVKQQVTEVGIVKGKVHYMAPEQYSGAEIDHRADIYSLGVVLYQLTTGQLPRSSKSGSLSMKRVIEGKIPLPSELRPDYPEELQAIVMRALAHDREDRYPDCASLRDDLLDFARQHDLLAFPKELGDYVGELVPPVPPKAELEAQQAGKQGAPAIVSPVISHAIVSQQGEEKDTVTFGTERVTTGHRPSAVQAAAAAAAASVAAAASGAAVKGAGASNPSVVIDHRSDPFGHTELSARHEAGTGDERALLTNEHLTPLPGERARRRDERGDAPARAVEEPSSERLRVRDDVASPSKSARRRARPADETGDEDPTVQEDDAPSYLRGAIDSPAGGARARREATLADARRGGGRWPDEERRPDEERWPDERAAEPPRRAVPSHRRTEFNLLLWVLGLLAVFVVGLVLYLVLRPPPSPMVTPGSGTSAPPPAQAGTLDFLATPAQAQVSIDGAQRCASTPCRIDGLPLGTLLVTVRAPKHRIWNQRVVLTADRPQLLLKPQLQPEQTAVDAAVPATQPKGKTPGKAGQPGKPAVGEQPGKQPGKQPGVKQPGVKKPGKRRGGRAAPALPGIKARKGKGRVLKGRTGSKLTAIVVDVRPAWAEVWVDGKLLGPTPIFRPLKPGFHRIDLRNPQYKWHVFYRVMVRVGDKIKIADTIRQ